MSNYTDMLSTVNKSGYNSRRSVYDISVLDIDTRKKDYEAVGISEVVISGNRFTNYGQYQFIWEKTYVKSPQRSASGSLGNLNSYATFLTPHLIMDFSVMSIDDYRAIMKLHYESNEFIVECYDPIYDKKIKAKMYFATEEMAKLRTIAQRRFNGEEWEEWVELVGVTEYKVELIGTNNDIELVNVKYFVNAPKQIENGSEITFIPDFATDGGEEDVYLGEDLIIGSNTDIPNETFNSRKKFKNWNTEPKGNGQTYLNGYAYDINDNLNLYAQWDDMSEYILTYNYGLADPVIDNINYSYTTSKKVKLGESIGSLPNTDNITPTVTVTKGDTSVEYAPYENPQWWKTPIKTKKLDSNGNDITDTLKVKDNEQYWVGRDTTIYLLYDKKSYRVIYYLNGKEYMRNDSVEFDTQLLLPTLVKEENGITYTTDGWFTTSDFKEGTKISGNMPPYEINLYARWVRNT